MCWFLVHFHHWWFQTAGLLLLFSWFSQHYTFKQWSIFKIFIKSNWCNQTNGLLKHSVSDQRKRKKIKSDNQIMCIVLCAAFFFRRSNRIHIIVGILPYMCNVYIDSQNNKSMQLTFISTYLVVVVVVIGVLLPDKIVSFNISLFVALYLNHNFILNRKGSRFQFIMFEEPSFLYACVNV